MFETVATYIYMHMVLVKFDEHSSHARACGGQVSVVASTFMWNTFQGCLCPAGPLFLLITCSRYPNSSCLRVWSGLLKWRPRRAAMIFMIAHQSAHSHAASAANRRKEVLFFGAKQSCDHPYRNPGREKNKRFMDRTI